MRRSTILLVNQSILLNIPRISITSRQLQDVIVIGCGASGIAALRRLHDAGLKVIGLEAAPRIGGRICTTPFGENVVDIGAAWCHGETANVVFELSNPHELLGRPSPDENWYVLSGGSLAPNNLVQETVTALSNAVKESSKDNALSISQCIKKAAESNESLRNSPLYNSIIEWYERANHLGGQDDPRQGKSLRGLSENWPCTGEFMLNWKGRGYKTILDVLLNKYPDPSKEIPVEILLNKEVESIRWGSSQSELDSTNPLVHVKCTDGSLYSTKSTIVTVSVGVLKERHNQLFNPPLMPEKIKAINNLELCVLNKIYVEFTEPDLQCQHCGLSAQRAVDVLLMMERASEDEVKTGVENFLEIFKHNFDITSVKSIIRSQWASNPLIRGAYSYRSVTTEEEGGSALELSEPLYHAERFPVVCFGGEATSHHRHNSVHGAIEAGFREADRLVQCFGKMKC
ncbi:hypothetical protein ACJJTC_017958 [Scirpophaga incertulas]